MKKMLSPRRKEGGSNAIAVVGVANSVTTKVEDVDGEISDEPNPHSTSISNNGSLRYI